MQYYSSPLRYPGGKSVLTRYLSQIIKKNKITNCNYVEPYAGGAGAALNLLFQEHVDEITINDADYNIFCFWYSIIKQTDSFMKLIEKTDVTIRNWKTQKKIILNNKKYSKLKVGFATFFLNRCNRSGIINGGPIGGYNQTGKWKIGARYNKEDMIERIERISFYRERINISNLDALYLLKMLIEKWPERNHLFFLDPPYFEKGSNLYLNFYRKEDHKQLSNFLNKFKANWILTYDNVPQISSLYNSRRSLNYDINYSANEHTKGKEIMFFSDGISIPECDVIRSGA